ncbi:MAG TPA: pyridoxal phosphate-dependent aminotransferase [Candidatus Hydrogenedentes bacterium]|nr:pyridoxal phosphate-dependent aminotransferase [Candidatus Hydrogenedentota bacterium]HNT88256.1 pyridoxal phosphate-dependent aminotransferase [Candidatus Hydrogenedentota bacterium]
MSHLAERMQCIDASGIRKVFALAAKMSNPVNLSIGQPDYDVDDAVKEIAIASIRAGFNSYTQTWGIEELREAASAYYERRFGVPLHNVMITSGVSGGLFLALLATVNPGDEVIFADPYFVMYKHLTRLLGGTPVLIDTYPGFKLRAESVAAAITDRTKLLIVNSPSNPTGVMMSGDELRALADVARRHDLLVISDEIYESLSYDAPPATMAGLHDRVLILNGFSKNAGMTGWRVGFAAGPEDVIQAMNTLQQYTFVCAPSFAQKAAVAALEADMSAKVAAYRRKRDLVYEGLAAITEVTRPDGAFYIFPKVPGGDGDAFVKRAIENNLLVIPGSVFSDRHTHLRISFAAPDETIRKGLDILARLAAETQG